MENNIIGSLGLLFDKTREVSGIGVWQVDLIKQEVYWDKQTKLIHEVGLDYKPSLETGINFYKEGFSREEITRLCNNIIENGKSFESELEIVTAKNNTKFVSVVGAPEYNGKEIVGFYGTFQDITNKKNQLSEIARLKERVELAAIGGKVGIWDYDPVNISLVWDDQMFQLYNVNRSDFSGAYDAWRSGLHPEDKNVGDIAVEDALSGKKDFDIQFRVVWPSGEIRYIQAKAKVYRNSNGDPVRMLGTNWDITEEVKKSTELKDYISKMKIVQDGMSIAMWKWDPVTNEAEWDDELYEMYGIPKDSKDKIAEWEAKLDPDVVVEIWGELAACIEGKSEYDRIFKMYVHGEVRYCRGKAEVIRKKNGEVDYLLGSNIDVTNEVKRENELKLQNENLQRLSQKLKESNEQLEEFAYIASHDLKAPIRHMGAYATFLDEDYGDLLDEDGKKMIVGIQDQAKRMTSLVDDLLIYSRVNKINLKVLETAVSSVVDEAVAVLGFDEDSSIELKIEDLGKLKIDVVKMKEVFNNLLTNSVKYNNSAVKKIKIWREENIIYLEDNGIGIEEKQKDKVFAFFKRLHGKEEYGGGTGAGMAIVKSVLDRHNASIDFESKVGKGTKFIIDFNACSI